jgi:tRNA(Ile)-lysidine synthase
MTVAPGQSVVHPEGWWRLTLSSPRSPVPGELAAAGPCCAVFDAEALPGDLLVRSPVPGDRIHVAGVGTRKLQDVLTDARVPREGRSRVPLLVADGTVLWAAGVVRGSAAPLAPGTRSVVVGTFEYQR